MSNETIKELAWAVRLLRESLIRMGGGVSGSEAARISAALTAADSDDSEAQIAKLKAFRAAAQLSVKDFLVTWGPRLPDSWFDSLLKDCGLEASPYGSIQIPKEDQP